MKSSRSPVIRGLFQRALACAARQDQVRTLLSFGQPTLHSHAEFFGGPMEIMPGLSKEEVRGRRRELCNLVMESSQNPEQNHLLFIPAARKKYMSENIPYPFRQNSNFLYLSGSFDPEALIVLSVNRREEVHTLFLADPDPMAELWDGPKTSVKAAVEHYGFDRAYKLSEFDKFFKEFAKSADSSKKVKVWCEDGNIVDKLLHPKYGFELKKPESPKALLDAIRVIKSPTELALLRQSCKIAADAFKETIRFCREKTRKTEPLSEHQIWAKLDYECRVNGADRLAYPPVVAAGSRGNVIHYVFNSNKCDPKDLVLIDAGCEFFGYCSDITRTFPVSGKFEDERHRVLYQMLLEVQTKLVENVEPGISLDQLFHQMSHLLVKGLESLGLIRQGLAATATDEKAAALALRFCPHHVGHHLGMDVHDSPSISRTQPLVPGNVVTIEPGLYIKGQSDLLTKGGKEFLGLAMRIEDDVAVDEGGRTVLSGDCPKGIGEIEGL